MSAASGGVRSSLDRVYNALADQGHRPSKQADDFMALCPAHPDKSASLHVTWRSRATGGGLVLVQCFGCEATAGDIAEALGLVEEDLFDEPRPPRDPAVRDWQGRSPRQRVQGTGKTKTGRLPKRIAARPAPVEPEATQHTWVEVETYSYLEAESGAVVQEVTRRSCSSCARPHKSFVQRFAGDRSGAMLTRKPPAFNPVLYRFPEVRAAIANGIEIWVLEGEKDVHTAEDLHLVATTNPGGGGVFTEAMADELIGAPLVHVVLDRDTAGWARGVRLHALLTERGITVQLYLPAVTATKADFTDHVEAGHTLTQLISVTIAEVATWHALHVVDQQLQLIRDSDLEVEARLQLAQRAHDAGETTKAEAEQRYAQRWATHSAFVWRRLADAVDAVRQLAAAAGTAWPAEAEAQAVSMLRQGTVLSRDLHERTAVPVPAELAPVQDPATRHVDQAPAPVAAKNQERPQRVRLPGKSNYELSDDGQIVEIKLVKRGDDWEESVRPVLNLDVQIVATEAPDVDDAIADTGVQLLGRESRTEMPKVRGEERPSHVIFAYTHPSTGQREQVRIEMDRAIDSSWLASLGLPGLIYDSKPAGRARVWDAIRQVSVDAIRSTLYRATGWRELPEHGWGWIHAGGAITTKGNRPVPVVLDGPLSRFDLPDPTDDAAIIRRVWLEDSLPMLEQLPARAGAVLVGHIFRSVLSPNGWTPVLVGSPGSYKTGVAALAMHFLGEAWDRRKPAVSLSGNGDTFNSIRWKLHQSRDAVLFGDDLAPTKDLTKAQMLLEELARLIHNREERSRMDRTGQSMHAGTAPRGAGLLTSEVMPRPGSGAERLVPVPLMARDIELQTLLDLDAGASRYGRALLMSSFLSWVASDVPLQREHLNRVAATYAAQLRENGRATRVADAYGNLFAGWNLLAAFLLEAEALDATEHDALLQRVEVALGEAMDAAEDPDIPTSTGARVREMLAHGFATGLAHVLDITTGETPTWPLAARLGHRRTPAPGANSHGLAVGDGWRMEAKGMPAGYVNATPRDGDGPPQLLLERLALEAMLKQIASSLADAPQMDSATAMRALHEAGVLLAPSGAKLRFTNSRVIPALGARKRMIVLDLHKLLGDEAPPEDLEGPARLPLNDGDPTAGDTDAPDTPSAPPAAPSPAQDEQGQDGHDVQDEDGHDEPSSPQEESTMAPVVPAPAVDLEGRVGQPVMVEQREPCVVCELPSVIRIEQLPIHGPCWERTTAATRRQAAPAPAATAAPVPSPAAATATAESATNGQQQDDQPVQDDVVEAGPVEVPAVEAPTVAPPAGAAVVDAAAARRTWDGRTELSDPAVAVCHAGGIELGTGARFALPEPLEHVGHLAQLAARFGLSAQARSGHVEAGTIVLCDDLAEQMGLPVAELPADPTAREEALREATKAHPFLTGALEAGWSIGERDVEVRGWMRLTHPKYRAVRIALASVMVGAVTEDEPAPAQLARRLQLFADQVGYPWRVSGGPTGIDMMIGLRWKDREALYPAGHKMIAPAQGHIEPTLNWSRQLLEEEAGRRYLHLYDRGGSWVAGVPGLELPTGEALHHPQGVAFDKRVPAYHRITLPQTPNWLMPHPLQVTPHCRLEDGTAWLTTPALVLAEQLGMPLQIHESWTWPTHSRLLTGWYERLRDARGALDTRDVDDAAAREMVKETYSRAIGTMFSNDRWIGRPGYFPERAHHIIAKARTNLLWRINQIGADTGIWPVAAETDSVAYVSDEPDPWKAWPGNPKHLGRGLGQLKPDRSGLLAEHISRLGGPRWDGKLKLAKTSAWMKDLPGSQVAGGEGVNVDG